MALIDSGSSVNLFSDTLYQQQCEPSWIRVCKRNIICADNRKTPEKGSAVFHIQLEKFTFN